MDCAQTVYFRDNPTIMLRDGGTQRGIHARKEALGCLQDPDGGRRHSSSPTAKETSSVRNRNPMRASGLSIPIMLSPTQSDIRDGVRTRGIKHSLGPATRDVFGYFKAPFGKQRCTLFVDLIDLAHPKRQHTHRYTRRKEK